MALAGVAGGLAARRLNGASKNPVQRAFSRSPLSGSSMPKLDLETLASAGRKVGVYGQQIGEIAEAADVARKKSK